MLTALDFMSMSNWERLWNNCRAAYRIEMNNDPVLYSTKYKQSHERYDANRLAR